MGIKPKRRNEPICAKSVQKKINKEFKGDNYYYRKAERVKTL